MNSTPSEQLTADKRSRVPMRYVRTTCVGHAISLITYVSDNVHHTMRLFVPLTMLAFRPFLLLSRSYTSLTINTHKYCSQEVFISLFAHYYNATDKIYDYTFFDLDID